MLAKVLILNSVQSDGRILNLLTPFFSYYSLSFSFIVDILFGVKNDSVCWIIWISFFAPKFKYVEVSRPSSLSLVAP